MSLDNIFRVLRVKEPLSEIFLTFNLTSWLLQSHSSLSQDGPGESHLFIRVVHRLIVDAKPGFHGSIPNGSNPLEVDVNAQYKDFEHHYTYIICRTFIVWLIFPRLGLFYGGLSSRKAALAILFQSFLVAAVITFQARLSHRLGPCPLGIESVKQ
jgi:hypothetical protein